MMFTLHLLPFLNWTLWMLLVATWRLLAVTWRLPEARTPTLSVFCPHKLRDHQHQVCLRSVYSAHKINSGLPLVNYNIYIGLTLVYCMSSFSRFTCLICHVIISTPDCSQNIIKIYLEKNSQLFQEQKIRLIKQAFLNSN